MALLAMIFLILHFGAGLALPYKRGFMPYFYKYVMEAGVDFEKRLNRQARPQSVRIVRGAGVGAMMGILGAMAGFIVMYAGHHIQTFGIVIELLFLSCCINFMTPMKVVRQVQKHLEANQPFQAVTALQPYMLEPLDKDDIHSLIRKTAEFIAISLNQFLLAPVFWLLVAGPIGLALYVTYSALNRAFGLSDSRRRYFGQFVRAVDTLLNFIPAILSAIFLAVSALFVSRSSPWRAITTVFLQSKGARLYYQGWLIAALAGGLGVTLGGPIRYSLDYSENHHWVGPPTASARLMPQDLSRAALLQYAFFMCVLAMVCGLMIFGA
jgi:adenosylcobinamide-phosphate synthase